MMWYPKLLKTSVNYAPGNKVLVTKGRTFTASFPASCVKVVTLQGAMALEESQFMGTSSGEINNPEICNHNPETCNHNTETCNRNAETCNHNTEIHVAINM